MGSIRHNKLTLTLPQGWEDATQVVALGPPDGPFRPNLVSSFEPTRPGEDSNAFAARQLPSLKEALQGYQVVKEGPATFGKLSGYLREHNFLSQGTKVGQLQLYVVSAGGAYTFTFTHLAPKLATNRKLAEQMFSQLKIE